ncbi:lytic murein transglycosylase [Saccharopolyspora griseoalba]|uniref:Lytic murein transglycosylase n=1 Tax=Saccharopolyspora griseoalba TaxID=1431848 RepID=A0ABW2LK23_9PSEU
MPRSGRVWLPAIALLLTSCSLPVSSPPEAPPAVAPPDPGAAPPAVELFSGGPPLSERERPQEQLAGWAGALSDGLNIPHAALEAYGYAQEQMAATTASCGLTWTVLAGIGAVESSHGRHGGARLDDTGRPEPRIIGMPLDGSDGVKRIDDTDGGELDGDRRWDRAVGPLQFIPSTWRRYQADADGDGAADPQDIDDAALTAARYLCDSGADLRDPDRFWAALWEYNRSRSYGQQVLDHADRYGRDSRELAEAAGE